MMEPNRICPHCGGRMRRPDARRQWTPDEDRHLRSMHAAGEKYAVIAAVLHRPESSISSRVYKLMLPQRRPSS